MCYLSFFDKPLFVIKKPQYDTMTFLHLKILADAMGLGKTIMTIALLLAHSEKGRVASSRSSSQHYHKSSEICSISDQSPDFPEKTAKFSGFHKLMKQKNVLIGGANLIICPLTLVGQWKVSIFPF